MKYQSSDQRHEDMKSSQSEVMTVSVKERIRALNLEAITTTGSVVGSSNKPRSSHDGKVKSHHRTCSMSDPGAVSSDSERNSAAAAVSKWRRRRDTSEDTSALDKKASHHDDSVPMDNRRTATHHYELSTIKENADPTAKVQVKPPSPCRSKLSDRIKAFSSPSVVGTVPQFQWNKKSPSVNNPSTNQNSSANHVSTKRYSIKATKQQDDANPSSFRNGATQEHGNAQIQDDDSVSVASPTCLNMTPSRLGAHPQTPHSYNSETADTGDSSGEGAVAGGGSIDSRTMKQYEKLDTPDVSVYDDGSRSCASSIPSIQTDDKTVVMRNSKDSKVSKVSLLRSKLEGDKKKAVMMTSRKQVNLMKVPSVLVAAQKKALHLDASMSGWEISKSYEKARHAEGYANTNKSQESRPFDHHDSNATKMTPSKPPSNVNMKGENVVSKVDPANTSESNKSEVLASNESGNSKYERFFNADQSSSRQQSGLVTKIKKEAELISSSRSLQTDAAVSSENATKKLSKSPQSEVTSQDASLKLTSAQSTSVDERKKDVDRWMIESKKNLNASGEQKSILSRNTVKPEKSTGNEQTQQSSHPGNTLGSGITINKSFHSDAMKKIMNKRRRRKESQATKQLNEERKLEKKSTVDQEKSKDISIPSMCPPPLHEDTDTNIKHPSKAPSAISCPRKADVSDMVGTFEDVDIGVSPLLPPAIVRSTKSKGCDQSGTKRNDFSPPTLRAYKSKHNTSMSESLQADNSMGESSMDNVVSDMFPHDEFEPGSSVVDDLLRVELSPIKATDTSKDLHGTSPPPKRVEVTSPPSLLSTSADLSPTEQNSSSLTYDSLQSQYPTPKTTNRNRSTDKRNTKSEVPFLINSISAINSEVGSFLSRAFSAPPLLDIDFELSAFMNDHNQSRSELSTAYSSRPKSTKAGRTSTRRSNETHSAMHLANKATPDTSSEINSAAVRSSPPSSTTSSTSGPGVTSFASRANRVLVNRRGKMKKKHDVDSGTANSDKILAKSLARMMLKGDNNTYRPQATAKHADKVFDSSSKQNHQKIPTSKLGLHRTTVGDLNNQGGEKKKKKKMVIIDEISGLDDVRAEFNDTSYSSSVRISLDATPFDEEASIEVEYLQKEDIGKSQKSGDSFFNVSPNVSVDPHSVNSPVTIQELNTRYTRQNY